MVFVNVMDTFSIVDYFIIIIFRVIAHVREITQVLGLSHSLFLRKRPVSRSCFYLLSRTRADHVFTCCYF